MCVHKTPYRICFYLIRVVLVQQTPCERTAANKVRSVCKIKIFVLKKIQCEIRVPPKKIIRVIPKAPLDFFMGFFDMNVAGRRDYALMTEALLVKPV